MTFKFVRNGKPCGKVSPEIQQFAEAVVKAFPAAIDEIFFIREEPIPPSPREAIGTDTARDKRNSK
jgi:hypothetical protein